MSKRKSKSKRTRLPSGVSKSKSKRKRLSSRVSKSKSKGKRLPSDRISELPDPILIHILSFLPTKLTVATSILSKRWKTIYPHVPSYNMYTPFITPDHLWSALQCRDTKLPLPLFRLYCHQPEVFNPLITAATQRGVKTLELNLLFSPLEMKTLSNILTCNTLTVLKLSNLRIQEKELPPINISSIKTLHLSTVKFSPIEYMINFFLSFPNLEELQINDVRNNVRNIERSQQRGMYKCLLNLVRANIFDIQLLPFICFSRELILKVQEVPLISMVELPIFYNLTQLELFFNIKQTWQEKWKWILQLLQQSHKLQHLIIHEENKTHDKNWKEPQTVPECLSFQLRTCLFRCYRGTSAELQFAEYVMRNSNVLLTITIHTSSSIDSNTKHQILQKLSVYARGCKLVID